VPAAQEEVHVEDVVAGHGRWRALGGRVAVEDEGQRRAPADGAIDLHEGQLVAVGQELDGSSRDGAVADGAGKAVEIGATMVQLIHSC